MHTTGAWFYQVHSQASQQPAIVKIKGRCVTFPVQPEYDGSKIRMNVSAPAANGLPVAPLKLASLAGVEA